MARASTPASSSLARTQLSMNVFVSRAEQCVSEGKAQSFPSRYTHTYMGEDRIARATTKTSVRMLDPRSCEGIVYFIPTPKSPHGVDVDPTGEFIVGGGKVQRVALFQNEGVTFTEVPTVDDVAARWGEITDLSAAERATFSLG